MRSSFRLTASFAFVTAAVSFAGQGRVHAADTAPATVTRLRCEYQVNPLGVGATAPRLSWEMRSNKRGERQSAYQILVAGSREALKAKRGDLWDRGKVTSDQTAQIAQMQDLLKQV